MTKNQNVLIKEEIIVQRRKNKEREKKIAEEDYELKSQLSHLRPDIFSRSFFIVQIFNLI